MIFETEFHADAGPDEVFDAIHRYKVSRDPKRFFPSKLVKWRFQVMTENVLGLGAVYDWKIWLLGIPVLAFQEQVIEWQDGRRVAYRAISGWEMNFRINLAPEGENTRVVVETSISLPGIKFLNKLLRPAYNWGLQKVCMRGLKKEGIKTHEYRAGKTY